MKKFACYRFIKCIHTRANEPPLPIRKETRASSEAMKQTKKRSVCCDILMKLLSMLQVYRIIINQIWGLKKESV